MCKVTNAIIMAAGTSSRFAPLSYERPKALFEVNGEILIERQIKQLREVGILDICVVTGYRAEQFDYLKRKYNVELLYNDQYLFRNNNSSIYSARDRLKNSYICSADNYFKYNVFETEVKESYYSAVYSVGHTNEWCIQTDENDYIRDVKIGGENAWYMLGHAFWNEEFSSRFIKFLEAEYPLEETKPMFWEDIFIRHISELNMKIKRYPDDVIFEFDSMEELREFDPSYVSDTRSTILKDIVSKLNGEESEITQISPFKEKDLAASGFYFSFRGMKYSYAYEDKQIRPIG